MSRPRLLPLMLLTALLFPPTLTAGDVKIAFVELRRDAGAWHPNVTLHHADTGWEHYADAWRVVTADGTVLTHRTLYHPHVNEQPFTRGGKAFTPPPGTTRITVEARDSLHGWSGDRVTIDLALPSGPRWRLVDDR